MDWDWKLPFPLLVAGDPSAGPDSGVRAYFATTECGDGASTGTATSILGRAGRLLDQTPAYRYSVTEMGFLRAFARRDPESFARFSRNAERVHLSGAGVTSPDSLLPHGEAFVRNYLLGRLWAEGALPAATICQSYLPDDFGHDPELPATLVALGIGATAFARLPGEWAVGEDPVVPPDGRPAQASVLLDAKQIDFTWSATDGSSVVAHWMPDWYGSSLEYFASYESLQSLVQQEMRDGLGMLDASPAQYVYVPVANDFQCPVATVTQLCDEWNANPIEDSAGRPVYAVSATFDDFVQLVSAAGDLAVYGGAGKPFFTTPYYGGCQATKPLLKILHQRAVRSLLAAEVFAAIASSRGTVLGSLAATVEDGSATDVLNSAWELVAPSTHHDYVTGTGHPYVYRTEQVPLLRAAVTRAEWLRDAAIAGVAAMLPSPEFGGTTSVAVLNELGFARVALAECDPLALDNAATVTCGGVTSTVQRSYEGNSLFLASVPPMGYATATATATASDASADGASGVTLTCDVDDAPRVITMENEYVRVRVSAASGWAVDSFVDKQGAGELVAKDPLNSLAIYTDGGNEYVFGCERGYEFGDSGAAQSSVAASILERNVTPAPVLRCRVRVTTSCVASDGTECEYVREYALVAGEPMLRMELAGRAPATTNPYTGTTVFARFPLGVIDTVVRGTPMHWSDQMPQLMWNGFTPYASHHYAMAYGDGTPVGAIVHADAPAWGLMWSYADGAWTNDGALWGAVLRNPGSSYWGWELVGGTDPAVHVRRYGLVAPSACAAPTTAGPLRMGLHFATPPQTAQPTGFAVDGAPATYSLARTTGDTAALVTAAKLGTRDATTLVLRVYQPANAPLSVAVEFDPQAVPGWSEGKTIVARAATALEQPLDELPVSGNTVTLQMERAIATVLLSSA